MRSFVRSAILAVALVGATSASAAIIPVSSYSMNNGNGTPQLGDNDYYDAKYFGTSPAINSTTSNAPLTGGSGLLTDGIKPTTGYGDASLVSQYAAGMGPFVGWQYQDPIITFNLQAGFSLNEIAIYTNSVFTGLAGPPGAIEINGVQVAFDTTAWSPYNSRLSILVDDSWASLTELSIQLFRGPLAADSHAYHAQYPNDTTFNENAVFATNPYSTGGPGLQPWILVSEVEFLTAAVPEPSTWLLMAIGFAGVAFALHRRRQRAALVPAT